jgi:hypothetical protein
MTNPKPAPALTDADGVALVRRGHTVLRPDPNRVILKLFLPGQEVLSYGVSRADAVVQRLLSMDDDEIDDTLAATMSRFNGTGNDLTTVFEEHYALLEHRLPANTVITARHRLLIGAYFTQTHAIEGAALFNPSMVTHPDQSGGGARGARVWVRVRGGGGGPQDHRAMPAGGF